MVVLGLQQAFPVPLTFRLILPGLAILAVSRPLLGEFPKHLVASVAVGAAVFAVWIAPDVIWPAWRHLPLFDNALVGHPAGNTPPDSRRDVMFLSVRIAISVVVVPVLEELFWRGWLMRWLIDSDDFTRVRLGAFARASFLVTALLFASEHGSFWDVGLAAGLIYNWWMVRTGNLWDCIVAHATTNGLLAAYVVAAGQWQYWL